MHLILRKREPKELWVEGDVLIRLRAKNIDELVTHDSNCQQVKWKVLKGF